MNTFKLSPVLIAVFLLPNVAVSADAAKEAMQKGKACFDKGDYDGADGGCPERGACCGHCCRVGRPAAIVGFRALPGCREQWHLSEQWAGQAQPQTAAGGPLK